MHISLDSALGRQRRLNSVGESVLQIAPDAAAAYSLRSLTGGDPDVVRVRRESDNTEKDFSGSQIESGEMARWVNEQPTLPLDLRELDTNTGERDGALIEAAAAYSLRKLKEDFTGDVVEVRRSSDDAVQSFTASEVADGTMEAWVNADVTIYQSNFSSSTDGWSGGTASPVGNQDGVSDGTTSKDNVLKLTKAQDSQAYIARDQGVIAGLTYTVSGSFYAPSSNTGVDGILIKDGIAGSSLSSYPSGYLTASGVWTDFSFSYTATVSGNQRINMGISSLGSNPNGSSAGSAGDVVYISDLQFVETTSNGHVRTWYDQSGNTNDATQTDPTKQPKIVDGGSLQKDSRNNPAIVFDDVDDNMDLTSDLVTGGAYSAIAYHEFNAASMILKGNLNLPRIRLTSTTNYQIGSFSPSVTQDFAVVSTQGLVSVLKDASHNARVYANGTESSSGQQNVGSGSSPFAMLGTETNNGAANGKLVEVIYYESDQSDNRTAIEANIGETYGITAIPAADDTVNGYVQTWYDQSGNGNDAEQTTASNQPKIVGEVTSGQPHAFLGAIEFDGTDDMLGFTDVDFSSGDFFVNATYAWDGTANSYIVADSASHWVVRPFASNGFQSRSENLTQYTISPTDHTFVSGEFVTTSVFRTSNVLNLAVNGSVDDTTNDVTSDTFSCNQLGARASSHYFGDAIKEVIIYDSDQSSNRPAIEANINNQYDIY